MALDPLSLAYGQTNQRLTCPRLEAAVPAAAVNVQLLDADGTELLAATAATKGTLSTTLSVVGDRGDTEVTLAAAAGLTAGEPLVLGSGVDQELVECHRINGLVVTLADPLARDWPIGTTVKSRWIYYDANLSVVATFPVGLYYQAIWTCTDWHRIRAQVFRIVNRETVCPIEFEHVKRALANVGSLRDGDDDPDLAGVRETAWQLISAMLLAEGLDPSTIRDPERIAQAGGFLAASLFVLTRPGGLELSRVLAGDPPSTGGLFLHWYRLARAVPTWVDRDQDAIRDKYESRVGPRRVRVGL